MATSADDSPKTLFAAKQQNKDLKARIASLQAQLGHGAPKIPAGSEPIKKTDGGQPVSTPTKNRPPYGTEPVKKDYPRNPSLPANVPNRGSMSPKAFAEMLDRCDDKTLLSLLSAETGRPRKEYDSGLIAKLHKEIVKRRKG
jgi:hypothetical protein